MKKHRNAISQVLAIIIIVAIIIAAFGGYLAGSIDNQMLTSTTSSIQSSTLTTTATVLVPTTATRTVIQYADPYYFPSSASETNSTLGLSLVLSMNLTIIRPGQAIKVSASMFNELPRMNNVSGASNWKLNAFTNTSNYRSLGFACFSPANFLVFQGFYDSMNVSTVTDPLEIGSIPFHMCFNTNLSLYMFQPKSTLANVSYSNPPNYDSTLNMSQWSSIVSYCNYASDGSGICLTGFPTGIYTIVAGDEWGQIVILHFEVYSNLSTATTQATTYTVSFPVMISHSATETLTLNIWTNNTSPNVISDIKVLTNASQIPHIIQFNVTQPSYIFLTEPYGVNNNGTAFDVRYANGGLIQLIANMQSQFLVTSQPISGLIWIEFIGPGEQ